MDNFNLILFIFNLITALVLGMHVSGMLIKQLKQSSNKQAAQWLSHGSDTEDRITVFSGMAASFIVVIVFMADASYIQPVSIFMIVLIIFFAASIYLRSYRASKKHMEDAEFKENVWPYPIDRDINVEPIWPQQPIRPAEPIEDEMPAIRNWEWLTFRDIIISLARKGPGRYISAPKRPDYIHLDGLLPTTADLRQISAMSHDRETSRVVFADTGRGSLVISGRTRIGTADHVRVDMQPEPGRENMQIPIMTIHVHPGSGQNPGLSDIDYISFLSDRRQIIMMILYEGGILFAMKTSATMSGAPENVQHRIAEIRRDVMRIWSNIYISNSILAFNKAVCLEYGMTLYRAPSSNEDVAHRIEVTNL